MLKRITLFCCLFLISFGLSAEEGPNVVTKGLFKGSAVLIINGQQKLLKEGEIFAGVTLISSSSKGAVIEIEGKRIPLSLSRSIGTAYSKTDGHEVRLTSKEHGHHFGNAIINGRSIGFMVDTGASAVSLSSAEAAKIGLRYKNRPVVNVSTAQGTTTAYRVILNKISVGTIELNNVPALVLEGRFPETMLLGNSFLSKLNMRVDEGVMILETKNSSKKNKR